jgi:thiamine-phosphate pyrophosphorylase
MNESAQALAQSIVALHADKKAGEVQPIPSHGATLLECALDQALGELGFWPTDAAIVRRAWLNQSQRMGGFDPALWPTNPIDFGLPGNGRATAFPSCPKQLGLYAVLPSADWVARMAQGGVPTLQLRFKSDDRRAVEREVKAAVAAVQGTPSLLFINDHWAQAIEHGAYGVHLGQEDLSTAPTERIRLAGLRLGLSTHGYAEMIRAESFGPSYLALGAVFPTTLKRMATPPQGLGRLRVYAQLMSHHTLVGIGGIDQSQFAAVQDCGVGSVAVVRAIVAQTDPVQAARELMSALR